MPFRAQFLRLTLLCMASACIASASLLAAQSIPSQSAYIKASNARAESWFGFAVALSGDTLVVGAPYESSSSSGINGSQSDTAAPSAGAVYVFIRAGTGWVQQAYLKPGSTSVGDAFGGAVAISGDTIVVGATGDDSASTGVNGDIADAHPDFDSGAAYVFVRRGTNWTQQAYLKPSNTDSGDHFGVSVAVSGDTILVGADYEGSTATGVNGDAFDNTLPDAGAAYIFVRRGTNWSQQAYLKASNTGGRHFFGLSVALSGNAAVVGAPWEASNATGINGDQTDNSAPRAGAAYVFARAGTRWRQQAYIKASNTEASQLFGSSVSVWRSTIIVGAPHDAGTGAAYVFHRKHRKWKQQMKLKAPIPELGAGFGSAVAIAGNTAVIGAEVQGDWPSWDAGAAYLFARRGTSWSEGLYLNRAYADTGDEFGNAVAATSNMVAVGVAQEDGAATGVNGDQASNAAPDAGAVYVFSPERTRTHQ